MTEEAKTPLPGEYWVSDDGSLIRIVGTKLNGSVIYENQAGFSFQFNSMTNWHYEPRCTSFEWVEPQPPDPGEGYEFLPDGEVLQEGDQFETIGKWRNTNNAGRKKLPGWTYRRKIKPVEAPDNMAAIIAEHTQQVKELTQRIGELVQQVNERDAVIEKIRTALRQEYSV